MNFLAESLFSFSHGSYWIFVDKIALQSYSRSLTESS